MLSIRRSHLAVITLIDPISIFFISFRNFFCLFFGLNIHYFGICPILSISFENCLLSKTVVKISFIMYDCSDFQFNPSKPIYDYNYIFYYTVFDIYIGKSLDQRCSRSIGTAFKKCLEISTENFL